MSEGNWINAGGWWVRPVKEKDVPEDGRLNHNRKSISVLLETLFITDPSIEVIEVSDFSPASVHYHRKEGWKVVSRGNSAFFYRPEETS